MRSDFLKIKRQHFPNFYIFFLRLGLHGTQCCVYMNHAFTWFENFKTLLVPVLQISAERFHTSHEFWGHLVHLRFFRKCDLQRAFFSTMMIFLKQTFCRCFMWQATLKSLLEILKFKIQNYWTKKKKKWNLTLWSMGKWKMANIVEMANPKIFWNVWNAWWSKETDDQILTHLWHFDETSSQLPCH